MLRLRRSRDARETLGGDRAESERRLGLADRELPDARVVALGGSVQHVEPERVPCAQLGARGTREREGGERRRDDGGSRGHGRSAARKNSGISAFRRSIMAVNAGSSRPKMAITSGRAANA